MIPDKLKILVQNGGMKYLFALIFVIFFPCFVMAEIRAGLELAMGLDGSVMGRRSLSLSRVFNGHSVMIGVGPVYALAANAEVAREIHRLLKQVEVGRSRRFTCDVEGFRSVIGANDAGDPIDVVSLYRVGDCEAAL